MDHNVDHQSYYCGMVNVLAVDWTRRDPNRQINDTKEYNIGEQMKCQAHCCYKQAEEGNTQGGRGVERRTANILATVFRVTREIKGGGHLNKNEVLTGVWVSRQQNCSGPSERRSGEPQHGVRSNKEKIF